MPRSHRDWLEALLGIMEQDYSGVFGMMDLTNQLDDLKRQRLAPKSTRVSRLIDELLDQTVLFEIELQREGRRGKAETKVRYALSPHPSVYAVGLSLKKDAYLSHASAMYFHALTDQIPKTVYVNKEQTPKPPPPGGLTQANINRAFKRPPRTSSNIFSGHGAKFVLLSGKHTDRLEVSPQKTREGELVDVTKLERTLIDMAVRPVYAGGPAEVVRAYENAAPKISVNTLLATLQRLDYVYPYHQLIGFLLDRAGYSEEKLEGFRDLGINWDFYFAHQMTDPDFDSRWRIFFPKGL